MRADRKVEWKAVETVVEWVEMKVLLRAVLLEEKKAAARDVKRAAYWAALKALKTAA